jgi:phage-related protein
VGLAYVTLIPSLRGFSKIAKRELKAALRGVDDTIQLKVEPQLDKSKAAAVGRQASALAQRAVKPVEIPIKFDSRRLKGLLTGIGAKVGSLASVGVKTAGAGLVAGAASAAITGLASAVSAALPALIGLGVAAANSVGVLVAVPGALAAAGLAAATLRLGMSGLSDAFKAIGADDAEKLEEALKKLAPTAQALVKRIAAFRPAFKAMQLGVQNALFRDTAKVFDQLASGLLPIAVAGFTTLAATINARALPALQALNTAGNRSIIASVFAAANKAAGTLLTTLRPVGQALLDVLGASSTLTAELSTNLAGAITRLAGRISAFATPDRLRALFDTGSAAIKQFIGLGRDVLGILGGIFKAAGVDSNGVFQFFTMLNQLVNSPGVQKSLSALFHELGRIGTALMPVLAALASALVPVAKGIALVAEAFAPALVVVLDALGPALGSLAPALVSLAPAAVAIAGALAPLAGILSGLVAGAAPGLAAFLTGLAAGLAPLVAVAPVVGQALGQLFTVLGTVAAAAGAVLAPQLGLLAQALTQLLVALAPLLSVGLNIFASVVSALVPDITKLVAAVAPLALMMGNELARALLPLIPAFTKIARIIGEELIAAMPVVTALFAQMVSIVTQLGHQFADNLLLVLQQIIPRLPELVSAALTLVLAFGQLFITVLPLLPALVGLATKVVELLAKSGLLQVMLTMVIVAVYALVGSLVLCEAFVGLVVRAIQRGIAFLRMLADGVKSTASGIVSAIGSVPGKITAALGDMGSLLYNAGRNVVQGLINGIKSMLSNLASTASSVAGTIRSFLPFSPAKEGPLSGSGNPYHSGQVIAGDLAAGVQSQLPAVSSAASQLAGMFGTGGPSRAVTAAGSGAGVTIDAEGDRWSQMLLALFKEVIRENGYGSNPVAALTS